MNSQENLLELYDKKEENSRKQQNTWTNQVNWWEKKSSTIKITEKYFFIEELNNWSLKALQKTNLPVAKFAQPKKKN